MTNLRTKVGLRYVVETFGRTKTIQFENCMDITRFSIQRYTYIFALSPISN